MRFRSIACVLAKSRRYYSAAPARSKRERLRDKQSDIALNIFCNRALKNPPLGPGQKQDPTYLDATQELADRTGLSDD